MCIWRSSAGGRCRTLERSIYCLVKWSNQYGRWTTQRFLLTNCRLRFVMESARTVETSGPCRHTTTQRDLWRDCCDYEGPDRDDYVYYEMLQGVFASKLSPQLLDTLQFGSDSHAPSRPFQRFYLSTSLKGTERYCVLGLHIGDQLTLWNWR